MVQQCAVVAVFAHRHLEESMSQLRRILRRKHRRVRVIRINIQYLHYEYG